MILCRKQQGATLITALVMLIVLTLLVLSAMSSSTTNLRIVGNMQAQQENIAAAQQASDQYISNNFTAGTPAGSSVNVTINNVSYAATVATPVCKGSSALKNSTPNLPQACLSSSTGGNYNIIYASQVNSGTSWCYSQQWDVQTTSDQTTMHQGVALNVPVGTNCP